MVLIFSLLSGSTCHGYILSFYFIFLVFIIMNYFGQQSNMLKRQLTRLFASNKIVKLSKLKSVLPLIKYSHLIYHISCSECDEFYIGLTNRRLKTRINEHKTNENSALFRHSFLTDHVINYSNQIQKY